MNADLYMQEDSYYDSDNNSDIPEYKSPEKPKINKIIYGLIGLILLSVIAFAFFSGSSRESVCGNDICEVDENCFDCSDDCKCNVGEICSEEKKICVNIEGEEEENRCGDGTCEVDENCFDCSDDCKCKIGEICSEEKKTCVKVGEEKEIYGNGVCDLGENCWDHPKDCKCMDAEYCSQEEKICITPVCGDGKCESYESPENCCPDCKCAIPGEICNEETKKCEMQEMEISDARATELAVDYFENNVEYQELEMDGSEVTGVSMYDEELIKMVSIQISEGEWFVYLGVTEDEKIIELNILE